MKSVKRKLSMALICLWSALQVGAQTDTLVLRDIEWNKESRASMTELFIPSANSLIAGFIYKANGPQKHPTLLLLHGFPGNERNLDLAQVARARGWNVIFFDYRGSWGSQGKFAFKNCVEDVANVVAYCKKYRDSLQIDTSNIALFGHSMGGWVCLKGLQTIPGIKKGFALSTWNIYGDVKNIQSEAQLEVVIKQMGVEYFVLNTHPKEIFMPVLREPDFYKLETAAESLSGKQIIMIDEHEGNKALANTLKNANKSYFDYQVWQTDHGFTNKRVALIKKVMEFLAR
jgi:pimeloyl-ACP methyl ester carboxylesterase